MRRYLSAIAVALVALSGAARVSSQSAAAQSTLPVVIGYDLDSTSFVYPIALGPTAMPSTVIRPQAAEGWYGTVSQPSGSTVDRRIKTADYDPTVVSCVSSSSALEPVSAGDLVQVNDVYNRPVYASIFSKASADSVEFDRSVDLTQTGCAAYRYRKLEAGTSATSGWFYVAGFAATTVLIDISQMVVTGGIDIQVECAAAHALTQARVLSSSNITAAGSFAVAIAEPWDVCRVGLKIGTSDDDSTPATQNEKISVFAIRRAQ
jgi:hypothetical protein